MRVQGQLGLCAEFQASLDLHKEEQPPPKSWSEEGDRGDRGACVGWGD